MNVNKVERIGCDWLKPNDIIVITKIENGNMKTYYVIVKIRNQKVNLSSKLLDSVMMFSAP